VSAFFSPPLSCAQAEERLMLRLFDELPAEDAEALDAHVAGCENCRRELAALRALEETLDSESLREPSPKLLADTRQLLANALDAESTKRVRLSLFNRLAFTLRPALEGLRAAPLAAAAMLLAGAGLGGFSGYQIGLQKHGQSAAPSTSVLNPIAASPIASVSSVLPQPDGKSVMVRYNRLVPESQTGSTDDPAIRNLLAMGIQTPTGPEVQDDAVRLLADACIHGPKCNDAQVRGALMSAARYEGDADLRGEALNGLEPYIADDTRVRDVFLESLMHDRSPAVRTQAIHMLSPVEADSSVRQVLHNVSMSDQDPAIRSMSRSMYQDANDVGLQIQ
jgi:hypothetical protein